jgi:hypothetical protein
MLNVRNTGDRWPALVKEIHLICHHNGTSFNGLCAVDGIEGLYRSEDWPLAGEDAHSLKGGYLYFHDSSAKASTFAAEIVDVIPVKETTTHVRVAFVVRRIKDAGVPWRGKRPTQKNPTGGVVSRNLNHR